MITKATAIAISACAVGLFLFSTSSPNDVYFAFVSGNIFIAILRLILLAILINILLRKKFTYKPSRTLCAAAAIMLVSFGVVTLVLASFGHTLIGVIKPFDFLFFIGTGLLYATMSVEKKPGRKNLPSFSTRSLQLQLFPSRSLSR